MDPPLLRRKLRVAKRRKKGAETNIRLLLLRATTSHIRNNSPDYFPLTIYSNLLEKLVKHRLHTTPPYCTLLLAYIFPLPLVLSRAYRRDTRWRIDDPSSKNSIRPCSKAGDASFSLSSTMERDFRVGTVFFLQLYKRILDVSFKIWSIYNSIVKNMETEFRNSTFVCHPRYNLVCQPLITGRVHTVPYLPLTRLGIRIPMVFKWSRTSPKLISVGPISSVVRAPTFACELRNSFIKPNLLNDYFHLRHVFERRLPS